MPSIALPYTGNHPTFGRLTVLGYTVLGYLEIFLDHGQRHLEELQTLVTVTNCKV